MNRLLKKMLCVLAAAVLLLGGVGVHADETPEKVTVIYGGSSWLGHYPAWVGIEKGLFQKHGLGVLFQNFYASSGRMGSLVAGDLDVASTGSISAIALMAAGSKGFMAFGTPDSYATVEGIIAREGIKTLADLKGKRIAAPFASSAHVLVLDILEQQGMDPEKDLTLLNLKVNEMPAAMGSGEIDACAAWTPHFNKLLNMPGNHLLVNDTEFSLYKKYKLGPGPDLLVVRTEFAQKYPNTSKAFVKGYFEAVDMLINEPEECAKVLMKLTNLSMEDQMTVLNDIEWVPGDQQRALMVDPGDFVTGMQQLAEFLVKHKQIDNAPPVKEWIMESMVSSMVAIPVGIFLGSSRFFMAVFDPIISLLRPLPSMSWIPLSLLWLGITETQKYSIVFMGSFAPSLLYIIEATKSIDPLLIRAARNLGASKLDVMKEVILPGSLPQIIAGLKVMLGIAWTCIISAELVAAREGLGFMIMNGKEYFQTDTVLLGMVMISITVMVIDVVFRKFERRLLPWTR